MTDLAPLTALGQSEPRHARFGALTLAERPDIGLASLALRRGTAAPQPFGLTLPDPGCMASVQGVEAFWTGPDQWMIAAQGRAEEDFAAAVRQQAPGCSVTEQTDAWVVVEIVSEAGGAALLALAEKLVNLPPASLSPGRATRTGLHHMSVFVIRSGDTRLAVLGMRSAAESLWHALAAAAQRLEI